ncbi:hypothetical protein [Clostridium algidicarnis]|uniref:hypothetical protein n=1 Tax=Clostridium algidicarnis TaxID=37659 RepID=UPI001C0C55E4|nr:hypothetical protein [Clostridium algidicarnis]MBU3203735.1 hypothetical protein [Clostridium algidicarnis]MBU3211889.1 hypothetical protein [Clostridium algidicarnis]MBU3221605.1 hypothetical protein [Clostridium algidicarnis]
MKDDIQTVIKRVGKKYNVAPKALKIYVGTILSGEVKNIPHKWGKEKVKPL